MSMEASNIGETHLCYTHLELFSLSVLFSCLSTIQYDRRRDETITFGFISDRSSSLLRFVDRRIFKNRERFGQCM